MNNLIKKPQFLKISVIVILTIGAINLHAQNRLPQVNKTVKNVHVFTKNNELTVQTQKIQRSWKWTGKGLVTSKLTHRVTGKEWVETKPAYESDWAYYGLIEDTKAKLLSIDVNSGNDEGFTSDYVEIVAEIAYPSIESSVMYKVWVYPDVSGMRTQVFFKGNATKYLKNKVAEDTNPRIIQKNGSPDNVSDTSEPSWMTSQTYGPKGLNYQVTKVDPASEYIVQMSWWDSNKKGRIGKVRVTSIDNEAQAEVQPATPLPERPETISFKIPAEVMVDGSFRIYIDKVKGDDIRISDLALFKKEKKSAIPINGISLRLDQLRSGAPEGYNLVTYHDSGVPMPKENYNVTGRVDYVPLTQSKHSARRYIGYYNDTQHRNNKNLPLIREEVSFADTAENVNWASMVSVEDGSEGLVVVKESHKCVNQYGVDTGEFLTGPSGLENTGTSISAEDFSAGTYKWAWGSWIVLYKGDKDYRELAVKQFDRYRFPTDKSRDMYSMLCSWGMSKNFRDGMNAASEESILKLMKDSKKLGIDLLLIDAGWEVSNNSKSAYPEKPNGWRPHPDPFPEGWKNVATLKDKLGIKLGLWGIAGDMTADDMIWNWDRLKLNQLKLDFATLGNHTALSDYLDKKRKYILYTNHKGNFSGDVTENSARYGYYWAREYGNIHLTNRKLQSPAGVVYVPWLTLRDNWHLSQYNNLNKYQLTNHNPELVNKKVSNAWKYTADYCVATSLFGVPEFFCFPDQYSDKAQTEIRSLLELNRKYRDDIWESFIFPVGDEPNDTSFTGFQAFNPEKSAGYFLIFREIGSSESTRSIPVRFLANKSVVITDLKSGRTWKAKVSGAGSLEFTLDTAGSYRYLKYEIEK